VTTTIREAGKRDLKHLAGLVVAFHEEHSRMIGGETQRKVGEVEDEVAKFLESQNDGYMVAVSAAEEIVGFRRWELHDGFYFTRELYVVPRARGHGVARTLIRHFETWLLDKGQKVACISCTPHNMMMIAIARSEGYYILNTIEMRKELADCQLNPRGRVRAVDLEWDLL
jgi:GNAT superfamily N-acetyltransferase